MKTNIPPKRYETLDDLLDGEEVSSRVRGVMRAILLASAVHQQEAEEAQAKDAERIQALKIRTLVLSFVALAGWALVAAIATL